MSLFSGLPGVPGADPANLDYKSVAKRYGDFAYPEAQVELGGKQFADQGNQTVINDIFVELSSGFEASVARFRIYNVFDRSSGHFGFESVKKQVVLGNSLSIKMGYLGEFTRCLPVLWPQSILGSTP